MMLSLSERIREMAEDTRWQVINDSQTAMVDQIEAFGLAVAKLVLEREPSMEMIYEGRQALTCDTICEPVYRAMTEQLLKELEKP
jgi:hypothetical protein